MRRLLAWLAALLLGVAGAHELQDNRATLVLRDATHLSMTLRLDFAQALRRELAPASAPQAFLLELVSMSPEVFARTLRRAQSGFEGGTRLILADGRELAFGQWVWPEPSRIQAALQEQVMRAVVAPGEHPSEAGLEVKAELASPKPPQAARLRLPAAFDKVLVVWYRPRQVWVDPSSPSVPLRF